MPNVDTNAPQVTCYDADADRRGRTDAIEATVNACYHDFDKKDAEFLLSEVRRLQAELAAATAWTDDDLPLPEDELISQAHPVNSGDHDTFLEALRLVEAKRGKYALVGLVNWLLHDQDDYCKEAWVALREKAKKENADV